MNWWAHGPGTVAGVTCTACNCSCNQYGYSGPPPPPYNPPPILPFECPIIGPPNGFDTQQECEDFLSTFTGCLHCPPEPIRRGLARMSGYDQGDNSGNSQTLPVMVRECPVDNILVPLNERGLVRFLGYDTGDGGANNFTLPVLGVDFFRLQTDNFNAPVNSKRFKARLLGYDSGDNCGLPTLPVYGLGATCKTLFQCVCNPNGFQQCGCNLQKVLCLHLQGVDSGVVPLTITNVLTLPSGIGGAGCVYTNGAEPPYGASTYAWTGCFQSVLGMKVFVIFEEGCNTTQYFACTRSEYQIWFFMPCQSGFLQYGCPGWAGDYMCDEDDKRICPGLPGGLNVYFRPRSICNALPGATWGGVVTDSGCCSPADGGYWYACSHNGTKYCQQNDSCPSCDQMIGGPYCSQCQCQFAITGTLT